MTHANVVDHQFVGAALSVVPPHVDEIVDEVAWLGVCVCEFVAR